MAYRYQMDNDRFQSLFPKLQVDTLKANTWRSTTTAVFSAGDAFVLCKEIAALRTLEFLRPRRTDNGYRPTSNLPLGESSAPLRFMSAGLSDGSHQSIKPACTKDAPRNATSADTYFARRCDIGCEIKVLIKDENLVKIETTDRTSPRGALCKIGRFEQLSESRALHYFTDGP